MINADSFLERNLSEVDSYIRLINGRCVNLNSTIELIRQAVKSNDEAELMSYYASNHSKIQQSSQETELPQLKEIPKQVNLKCDVDVQSLNQFIEDLEGLNLQIAALEGDVEDEGNHPSTTQYQAKQHSKIIPKRQ